MKSKEQIIGWLKSRGAYGRFMKNRSAFHEVIGEHPFRMDEGMIANAFQWHRTEEGVDYWNRLDYTFRRWFTKE